MVWDLKGLTESFRKLLGEVLGESQGNLGRGRMQTDILVMKMKIFL